MRKGVAQSCHPATHSNPKLTSPTTRLKWAALRVAMAVRLVSSAAQLASAEVVERASEALTESVTSSCCKHFMLMEEGRGRESVCRGGTVQGVGSCEHTGAHRGAHSLASQLPLIAPTLRARKSEGLCVAM